jgi:hypothetical protein
MQYVQIGTSLSIYSDGKTFLTTVHPRDEDLQSVVEDGRARATVALKHKGNAIGGFFHAWRGITVINVLSSLKMQLLNVTNIAEKGRILTRLNTLPAEEELDIKFSINMHPRFIKAKYDRVLTYLHSSEFWKKSNFIDVIENIEFFDFLEEEQQVTKSRTDLVKHSVYYVSLIDFGACVGNAFESPGTCLLKFAPTANGINVTPVWDSSVSNTEMGFSFHVTKRSKQKKKRESKADQVPFLGEDASRAALEEKIFEEYFSDENDYDGDACYLSLERVHFVHQAPQMKKVLVGYTQRLFQKLLWQTFKKFEKRVASDIEASVLRSCNFCKTFSGNQGTVEEHEETCPKRTKVSINSLTKDKRQDFHRMRKRERIFMKRAKEHFRGKLHSSTFRAWKSPIANIKKRRGKAILKMRRVRLKPCFDKLERNWATRKAIVRKLRANFGRRNKFYSFGQFKAYYLIEKAYRDAALANFNERDEMYSRAISFRNRRRKKVMWTKWRFLFEMHRQRLLILAVNSAELVILIAEEKQPKDLTSLSPMSFDTLVTLIGPYYICREVSSLRSGARHVEGLLEKLLVAHNEGAKVSVFFVARDPSLNPSCKGSVRGGKSMLFLSLSAARLGYIPVINLQSNFLSQRFGYEPPPFCEILRVHHMGLAHLSSATTILNTAITSKSMTIILESKFDATKTYHGDDTETSEVHDPPGNVYTHVKVPRTYNSERNGDAKTCAEPPMDHFVTKLFDGSTGKFVLRLNDTMKDWKSLVLRQSYEDSSAGLGSDY